MQYPDFFDAVPTIRLRDPLADFLGAVDGGIIEFSYLDAVKLAGHSCPTVASAYWLTRQALRALYGEDLPERGGVRVEFAADVADGVAGVIANVVSMLTGAAGAGGFKGLAGQFERRALLSFNADIPFEVRYTRLDGHGQVDAAAELGRVPANPETGVLMRRCLSGAADVVELRRFGVLWQERVRSILLDHGEDAAVFSCRRSA
ncbi:MAG: hypothetical protein D4S02_06870 [Rhodocyclaceae bacterium]|nr:MAG: hypothetical protein D4S02_06870 [Rhodocyclaceae bacterium]